jgi:hypothetical protein
MRKTASWLPPARALAIVLIVARDVERREPVLATDDPELVGRAQLIGRVEAAEMNLYLVAAATEQRGAAIRTEVTVVAFRGRAADRDCIDWKDSSSYPGPDGPGGHTKDHCSISTACTLAPLPLLWLSCPP